MLTDAGLENLAGLTHLQRLSLFTPITGTGFIHLAKLQELDSVSILSTGLTDEAVEPLAALKISGQIWIKPLSPASTHMSEDGIRRLRAALGKTLRTD